MVRSDGVHVKSESNSLKQYTKLLAPKNLCINNRLLHNSSSTLFWSGMDGATYYYLILKTCRAPPKHVLRPGFRSGFSSITCIILSTWSHQFEILFRKRCQDQGSEQFDWVGSEKSIWSYFFDGATNLIRSNFFAKVTDLIR